MNFQNIPNEQISGIDDEELRLVWKKSGEIFIFELSDEFLSSLSNEENGDISSDLLKKRDKIEKDSIPNLYKTKW